MSAMAVQNWLNPPSGQITLADGSGLAASRALRKAVAGANVDSTQLKSNTQSVHNCTSNTNTTPSHAARNW